MLRWPKNNTKTPAARDERWQTTGALLRPAAFGATVKRRSRHTISPQPHHTNTQIGESYATEPPAKLSRKPHQRSPFGPNYLTHGAAGVVLAFFR